MNNLRKFSYKVDYSWVHECKWWYFLNMILLWWRSIFLPFISTRWKYEVPCLNMDLFTKQPPIYGSFISIGVSDVLFYSHVNKQVPTSNPCTIIYKGTLEICTESIKALHPFIWSAAMLWHSSMSQFLNFSIAQCWDCSMFACLYFNGTEWSCFNFIRIDL